MKPPTAPAAAPASASVPAPMPTPPQDPVAPRRSAAAPLRKPRRRLTPDARLPLILDAALETFATQGYTAARIDDIAARAGLSKGGFYAHFSSKEGLFVALLQRKLDPPALPVQALLAGVADTGELVRRLVAKLYATLDDPQAIAVVRLLFTEGSRLPQAVELWRQHSLETLLGDLAELLSRAERLGLVRPGVAAREPWLLLAPLVYGVVRQVIFGNRTGPTLAELRQAHIDQLCEWLAPT